jgi:hypothetical protein
VRAFPPCTTSRTGAGGAFSRSCSLTARCSMEF